jgi:outer membrane receptor for ferrienterochelin and colicin
VTKKATQTTGTLITTQIGSSQDHGRISGRIGFGDDKSATRVYAMNKDVDQSTSPITQKTTNDALDFQQAGFRHDTQTENNGQLSIHGDIYQGDSQLARSTPETVQLRGGNLFALYKPDNDIRLQAYYDYTSRERTTTKSTYNNFDLDYQQTVPFSNHSLLFGGGARYTMHDYSHSGTSFTITVDPKKRNDTLYRAFIQDEMKWDIFSITPGIKYEYNDYVSSQWQPSIKVAISPSENQTLWL